MVTKDEMTALLPVHGTLLDAMEMILQARQQVTRRSEIERRDMSWKELVKDLQVAVAVGLAQGGQALAPAWKMVADVLIKVQERIEDIPMDKYLQKKYRFEGSHNGVIRIPTVDGELWDASCCNAGGRSIANCRVKDPLPAST